MTEYLLDTNAYFNVLNVLAKPEQYQTPTEAAIISSLTSTKMYISTVTKVEIISVLGKYARGSGSCEKCTRIISQDGSRCANTYYLPVHHKMKNRRIRAWKKLISDTTTGKGPINFDLLPFDEKTIVEAQKIIEHALVYSFASMDALIAATASIANMDGHNMTVITSDHSLLACLAKCNIPYWDAFASRNQTANTQQADLERTSTVQ